MTRVLRGAWSRRGTLATLVAMTAVVVAGTVAVLGVGEAAGTSRLLALPLLLLGVVAVPETGRVLALRRREEIGLHRLRGVHGPRLLVALLAEPLLAIVLGTLLGLAAGAATTALVTRLWLGEAAAPLTADAVLVAGLLALGALLVVALGTASALREPLSAQVSVATRPRRATTVAIFGQVLVIVAAGVAAYRSGVGDDPDAVVLLGPALVGLAAGQVTVWLVRLAARLATAPTAAGGLPGFLAVRRLARSADVTAPLRLLVAAGVVGVVSLTGALATSDWADDTARARLAGEALVPVDGSPLTALSLTRALDPEGEHLMAAVSVTDDEDVLDRWGFVDAARYDAVVGDLLEDTAVGPAGDQVAALATGREPQLMRGDRVELRLRQLAGPVRGRLAVTLEYVTDDDSIASFELAGAVDPGTRTLAVSRRVPDCRVGCALRSIEVASTERYTSWNGQTYWEAFAAPDLRLVVDRLRLGEDDLLDQPFLPDPAMPDGQNGYRTEQQRDDRRVLVNLPDGLQVNEVALRVVPEAASGSLPVLLAGADAVGETVRTPGSQERTPGTVTEVPALPFLGTGGVLADLPTALVGDSPAVPSAEVGVVVGADAPADLVDELVARTGTEPLTRAAVREEVIEASGARQAVVYALMALACALIALIALASAVGRQRAEHRRDVAALRVVGVPRGTSRGAGRREVWLLGALAGLGVAAGGALAVHLLLDDLPLVRRAAAALPIDLGVAWLPLLLPALLASVAVVLLGARGRDVPEAATRPATLRDRVGEGVDR